MKNHMSVTPKKPIKRGPKSEESVNDYCRICKTSFKVFGGSKSSFENLFKPSQRKESKGLILAVACKIIGIHVFKSPNLSERVCRPCGRKIRNAADNLTFIRERIHKENANSPAREKRTLPTTITPNRKPEAKVSRKDPKALKQLFSEQNDLPEESSGCDLLDDCESLPFVSENEDTNNEDKVNTRSESNDVEDELRKLRNILTEAESLQKDADAFDEKIKNFFNIDTLKIGKKESEVRVVIAYPNGEVVVKQDFDRITTILIRGLALKKWKTVANNILNHEQIMEDIPAVLRKRVSREFQALSSESILKGSSPEELAAFSNKLLVQEILVTCPIWYSVVNGACGLDLRQNEERRDRAVNAMALSTSVLARQRNPTLSTLAYRLSVVLFNSGCSYYGILRLNHLGICMSPDRLIDLQKKMGISSDSKVLIWKKSIEEVLSAIRLLEEVKTKQVPVLGEDDMNIDVVIDFKEESLKTYSHYSNHNYEFCKKLLEHAILGSGDNYITDTTIDDIIYLLQTKELPHYRFVLRLGCEF